MNVSQVQAFLHNFSVVTVFCRIQRRQVEQIKEALPVILKVINMVSSDADVRDKSYLDNLFGATYTIGTSIQKICEDMVQILIVCIFFLFIFKYLYTKLLVLLTQDGRRKQELRAILGLYALENIVELRKLCDSVLFNTQLRFKLNFIISGYSVKKRTEKCSFKLWSTCSGIFTLPKILWIIILWPSYWKWFQLDYLWYFKR